MRNGAALPRYETRAARELLNSLLGLPHRDDMQDWDVELADPARLAEFCDLYDTSEFDAETRFTLMRLIVASLDDLLAEPQAATIEVDQVHRVEELLRRDAPLHLHTVNYWRLGDEADPLNVFSVTPLMRRIWDERYSHE